MAEDTMEKAIWIIPFSGKHEEWRMWSRKFLARAKTKKFKDVLLGDVEVPDHDQDIDVSTNEGKLKMAARVANDNAYNELLLSCTDEVSFGAVDEAVTSVLPDGDAAKAWANLTAKYEPKTTASKVQLKREFNLCILDNVSKDPDEWISDLERIRQRLKVMKSEINDTDLMIHILNNLPPEYESLVEKLELEIEATDPLTMEGLRDQLRNKYRRLQKALGKREEDETALAAGFNKQFKGRCRNCGMFGHKAADCKKKGTNKGKKSDDGDRNRDGKRRFNGKCNHCGIFGHMEKDCRKKKAKENGTSSGLENSSGNDEAEVVMMAHGSGSFDSIDANTWLGDTGSTAHMTNSLEGMFDLKKDQGHVRIGDGKLMTSVKIGSKRMLVVQKNGETKEVTLQNVKYVPELWTNLFSVTSAMNLGFKVSGEKNVLHLSKGNFKMSFDWVIKSPTGYLLGIQMIPQTSGETAVAMIEGHSIGVDTLHYLLGHASEAKVRATGKFFGWVVKGKMTKCEECAISKAKQKSVPKESGSKATKAGERLFIDISSIKATSAGGAKFWLLVIDEATDMKWSFFLKAKSELKEKLIPFVKELKVKDGKIVKYVRLDNAGENTAFEEGCKKEGFGITFEYSAPGTPQQNGVVERAFATLYGRVRAMMNHARFSKKAREDLWAECGATATKLENLLLDSNEGNSPYELFYGKKSPGYARNLRVFGEMGVITTHTNKKIRGKLEDRGKTCVFVGYAENHAGDVYRMFNTKTRKVSMSRDITWLGKVYGDYFKLKDGKRTIVSYEIESEEENDDSATTDQEGTIGGVVETAGTSGKSVNTRLLGELKRLNASYNPLIQEVTDMAFVSATESDYLEPQTFSEAWEHPDATEREGWRAGIRKEFRDMLSKQVWRKCKKDEVDPERRLVGCKWVFKKKKNGVYRARLVALGYSQIPGVDFTDNFAPVVNDVSLRLVLMMWLSRDDWDAEIVDVETAFLYGNMDETVYMKIPQGYKYEVEDIDETVWCLELQKCIYGLVQAARQWWKELIENLRELEFKRSKADPCLLYRENNDGMIIICIYVDDILIVGSQSSIEAAVQDLKTKFTVKRVGTLQEYVGCTVLRSGREKKVQYCQSGLISRLEKDFGYEVENMKKYETPAAPRDIVMRPQEGDDLLSQNEQAKYRSGVGMLLYLVKFSRPDIANSVRELSKVMDGATKGHLKCLLRVIKFVLDTREKCLQMDLSNFDASGGVKWGMKAFCDSDFAGDKDTRISVTGFVIYVMGALISWRSRGQKSVTLSSSEAEYVALSEVCAEIMFIKQVLEFLKMKVELPIVVHVDNVGAIYLASNATTSQRTRHIDVRYHFVRDYVEDGVVQIVFVRSEDNDADMFTKNVSKEVYKRHMEKYMGKQKESETET